MLVNNSSSQAPTELVRFGTSHQGDEVMLYTLRNTSGMEAKIMSYGATLISLLAPDSEGNMCDVVLGFDTLEGYLDTQPYMGATVGRVANRIANGHFILAGKEYNLHINNGPNHLHGGKEGFSKKNWAAHLSLRKAGTSVQLYYTSPDGEEGYPGTLKVSVSYTLRNDNCLEIKYSAETDMPTPINLTNHSYFNLKGEGDILNHQVMFNSDHYTPVNEHLIPTGEIKSVSKTPFDLRTLTTIGDKIGDVPGGYDHNFLIRGEGRRYRLASVVKEPTTGRVMEMYTDEPGFQFYTGNFLNGTLVGKGGVHYAQHAGLCLEAQHFPDSLHNVHFPNIVLVPRVAYTQKTAYCFSTTAGG